jgi:hypothetical protein
MFIHLQGKGGGGKSMKRNGESKYLFTNLLHAPLPILIRCRCLRRIADVFSQKTLPMISAVKYRELKNSKPISTVAYNRLRTATRGANWGTDRRVTACDNSASQEAWQRRGMQTGFLEWKLEYSGTDGRKMFNLKEIRFMWTGLIWLMLGASDGLLWAR